jgi:hypothetical protein
VTDSVPLILLLLGAALFAASLGALARATYAARRQDRQVFVLTPTILFAFAIMLTSVGWLVSEDVSPAASEAIRSGGLASAAVLALYALWLNDQRRRTEQERLATEQHRGRIEQDRLTKELEQLGVERLRIIDERFTKAIELLGDPSDRVRIGALILLDGLTRTRPELVPDVLDQLCGYLRGPVDKEDALAEERERRVRRHAQRVLRAVLNRATETTELDLSGAELDEFRLTGGTVSTLRLDNAALTGKTTLDDVTAEALTMTNCTTSDDVVLTGGRIERLVITGTQTRLDGRLVCHCDLGSVDIESATFVDSVELRDLTITGRFAAHAKFCRRLTITRATFTNPPENNESIDLFHCEFGEMVLIEEATIHGATRFAGVTFDGGLSLNARFLGRVSAEQTLVARANESTLQTGWRLDGHDAKYRRLVAPRLHAVTAITNPST